jgi:cardiolipin synthase (CMP-forming)
MGLGLLSVSDSDPGSAPLSKSLADGANKPAVPTIQTSPENAKLVDDWMTRFQVVVAGTTLWSGLSYVWNRNAVTILGPDEALKQKQGRRGRMIVGSVYGVVIVLAAGLAWKDWMKKEDEKMDEKEK